MDKFTMTNMTKEKLTLPQLVQYLSKAAWILKGPVDASDFKVYIFPLYKRVLLINKRVLLINKPKSSSYARKHHTS
jgi:hypothetical protein